MELILLESGLDSISVCANTPKHNDMVFILINRS